MPPRESRTVPLVDRLGTTPLAANRLGGRIRLMLLALSAGLFALLIVARNLSPSPTGMGTHQQLGLPPCSIRLLYGVRCPACGMTTSWAHLLRGDVLAAWHSNAGGLILAVLALWGAIGAAKVAVSARTPSPRAQWMVAIGLAGGMCVAVADWLLRIM